MTVINRSALVAYSARQMFELVNSIEEYPRFLPWCSKGLIKSENADEIEASLDITWAGMHKMFTTRNRLHRYDRIDIELVSGPFRHLNGHWTFVSLNDKACKVCLELDFEFTGNAIDKLFQPIFNHIANSLVEAFCKRAVEIYGQM